MKVKTNIQFFVTIAESKFNAIDVLRCCVDIMEKQESGKKYIPDLAIPKQYCAIAKALEAEGILTRTEAHDPYRVIPYRVIDDTKLLAFIQDLTKAMNEKTRFAKPIMEENVTSTTAKVIELLYWDQNDLKQGFLSKEYARYLASEGTMECPSPITDNLADAEVQSTFSRDYIQKIASCDMKIQSAVMREVLKTEGIMLKSWA